MSEWIKCSDRLPEEGMDGLDEGIEDVLIAFQRICDRCLHADGLYISIGYYMMDEWLLGQPLADDVFDDSHNKQINVIYWMPLPSKPKSEEDTRKEFYEGSE